MVLAGMVVNSSSFMAPPLEAAPMSENDDCTSSASSPMPSRSLHTLEYLTRAARLTMNVCLASPSPQLIFTYSMGSVGSRGGGGGRLSVSIGANGDDEDEDEEAILLKFQSFFSLFTSRRFCFEKKEKEKKRRGVVKYGTVYKV